MKRIDQLDGLRTIAIVAVFLNHAFRARLLWAGVDLFFILSGFLITGILIRGRETGIGGYFKHFYERRARRILPPLVMLLLVTTLLFGTGWMRHWYLYPFAMNFSVFIGSSMPDTHSMLWSLAVEEQFYLVWPFAIYLLSERAIGWTAGTLMVLAPLLRWAVTGYITYPLIVYELTPFRMDLLAAGALVALLWKHHREKVERYGAYGLVPTGLALGSLVWLSRLANFKTTSNTPEANVVIYEMTLIASLGVVLWALSGRWVWMLTWGPVRYLGRISYSVYLIHLTALIALTHWISNENRAVAVAAAVSVVYAAISWHLVEKPILFWKPRSRVRVEAVADERAITAPEG